MAHFVLDASIALAWGYPDESDPYAQRVLDALSDNEALVPAHWCLEVANAIVTGERRGRLAPAEVSTFLGIIERLPIRMELTDPHHLTRRMADVARANRLSSYDAVYLELAQRRGLPLATLDAELRRASLAADVKLFDHPIS